MIASVESSIRAGLSLRTWDQDASTSVTCAEASSGGIAPAGSELGMGAWMITQSTLAIAGAAVAVLSFVALAHSARAEGNQGATAFWNLAASLVALFVSAAVLAGSVLEPIRPALQHMLRAETGATLALLGLAVAGGAVILMAFAALIADASNGVVRVSRRAIAGKQPADAGEGP